MRPLLRLVVSILHSRFSLFYAINDDTNHLTTTPLPPFMSVTNIPVPNAKPRFYPPRHGENTLSFSTRLKVSFPLLLPPLLLFRLRCLSFFLHSALEKGDIFIIFCRLLNKSNFFSAVAFSSPQFRLGRDFNSK